VEEMVDKINKSVVEKLGQELSHKSGLLLQPSLKGRIYQSIMLAAWIEQHLYNKK
jgi:hypothetical protein